MQGQILVSFATGKSGTILGDDTNRYVFDAGDWRAAEPPRAGMRIDFVAAEGGAAREIFPLPGASGSQPPLTAIPVVPVAAQPMMARPPANNSQLLGWLGIGCLVLGFVIPLLPTIAAFILGLVGADSAKKHGDGTGLVVSRIAWIGAAVLMLLGILIVVWALAFAWPLFQVMFEAIMQSAREGGGTRALLGFP